MKTHHQFKSFVSHAQSTKRSRSGFTMLQIVVSIAIVMLLGAIIVPSTRAIQSSARRAQCDTRLKAIALSLNTHRQEAGQYPAKLAALVSGNYYKESLRCPSDPRADGSYEDFYIKRSPRDRQGLPILVCPFHEQNGARGGQAFIGSYTKQFATKPAVLQLANNVTILRPGKSPLQGAAGMELSGGDRIQTNEGGIAEIRFADGSVAALESNTDVSVLQSFIEGQSDAPLYSLLRQEKGTATYTVNHGSKFDVVTPTVTAGALGTKFTVTVDAAGETSVVVIEGNVYLTTAVRTALAPLNTIVQVLPDLPGLPNLPRILGF